MVLVPSTQVALELLHIDVCLLSEAPRLAGLFDCVLMNPPFGTQVCISRHSARRCASVHKNSCAYVQCELFTCAPSGTNA